MTRFEETTPAIDPDGRSGVTIERPFPQSIPIPAGLHPTPRFEMHERTGRRARSIAGNSSRSLAVERFLTPEFLPRT